MSLQQSILRGRGGGILPVYATLAVSNLILKLSFFVWSLCQVRRGVDEFYRPYFTTDETRYTELMIAVDNNLVRQIRYLLNVWNSIINLVS